MNSEFMEKLIDCIGAVAFWYNIEEMMLCSDCPISDKCRELDGTGKYCGDILRAEYENIKLDKVEVGK